MARILVVEDNQLLANRLVDFFAGAGYAVQWASTLSSARLLLSCQPFQAVILDWNLPDGIGLHLCSHPAIRQRRCAVWVVTGEGEEQLRQAAACPGVVAALPKPVDSASLLAAVQAHLRYAVAEPYPRLVSSDERRFLLEKTAEAAHGY